MPFNYVLIKWPESMLPSTSCPICIVMMPVKLFSRLYQQYLQPTQPSYCPPKNSTPVPFHLHHSHQYKYIYMEHTDLYVDGTTMLYIPARARNCSVANVHVTRVLSVDWMVQPNHGQQAIFQSAYSHKQYTYIGIHRWTD